MRHRGFSWLGVAVLAGLLGPLQRAEAGVKLSGPLVGHVTSTTATIWAYAGARERISVKYRREADPKTAVREVAMPPYTTGPGTCRVTLKGLDPDTRYVYAPVVRGGFPPQWKGRFKTAPPEGRPARFRVAFTSCMEPDHPDLSPLTTLLRQKPDVFLLLGDNVYSDTTNRARIWQEHLRMRRRGEFADVIKNVPTYAVWDDHDFANDNSDGTAPGKEGSLLAFQELFANPSFGLPQVPGVFFRFGWADVEFFMLDVRYHRSPNHTADGPRKKMLGDGQMAWLVDGLRRSKAKFKVLVSGSSLKDGSEDVWKGFAHARDRLFRAIRDHRVSGVLFFSGNLHRSLIREHPKAQTGFYDLVETISSGIGVGGPQNFATVDFDTTAADPTAHVRIVERNGRVSAERTVLLSELR